MVSHHRDGRRSVFLVAVVLCVLTALWARRPADLEAVHQAPRRPPGDQAATGTGTTIIRVRGNGRVIATADRATVEVGAESRHPNVALALRRNAETVDRVIRSLRRAGVAEEAILPGALQVNSERLARSEPLLTPATPIVPQATEIVRPLSDVVILTVPEATLEPESAPQVTYTVWNTVRFTTSDLDGLPDLLAAALDAGATQVLFVRYEVSDDSAYRRQAVGLAVEAAIAEAQALADVLGVELRRVSEVQLDGSETAVAGAELPLWSSSSTLVAGAPGYVEANVTLLAEVSGVDVGHRAPTQSPTAQGAARAARKPTERASAASASTRRVTTSVVATESHRATAASGRTAAARRSTEKPTERRARGVSPTPPAISESRASQVAERETLTASRRQTATAKATRSPAVTQAAEATRKPAVGGEADATQRPTVSREAGGQRDGGRQAVGFRTLLRGSAARYREPEPVAVLVSSETELADKLAGLLPRGITVDVHFDRYLLLGVFLGSEAPLEAVTVEAITVRGSTILVEATRAPDPAAGSEAGSTASPYELVRLSRSDLPASARQAPTVELRLSRS